jgi:hypothetical protein
MFVVVMYAGGESDDVETVFGPFGSFEDASRFAVAEVVNKRGREYDWFELVAS